MLNTPLLVTYQVWQSPRVAWTGEDGENHQSEWLHEARAYAEAHEYNGIKIEFKKEERKVLGQQAPKAPPSKQLSAKDRQLTQSMLREVAENPYSRDARCRALASAATGAIRPSLTQVEKSSLKSWPINGLEIQEIDRALVFDPRLYLKTPAQHAAVVSLIRQGYLGVVRSEGRLLVVLTEKRS